MCLIAECCPVPTGLLLYNFWNLKKKTSKIHLVPGISDTEVQFSSVVQLCPTLCNPMNHSTLGLPVHHQLLEFTQTHVH